MQCFYKKKTIDEFFEERKISFITYQQGNFAPELSYRSGFFFGNVHYSPKVKLLPHFSLFCLINQWVVVMALLYGNFNDIAQQEITILKTHGGGVGEVGRYHVQDDTRSQCYFFCNLSHFSPVDYRVIVAVGFTFNLRLEAITWKCKTACHEVE